MLLKCIRRINHKKGVISSALVLIIIASSIAGAAITAPVTVFALSAGGIKTTIASIIISLMMQSGAAPTNTQWLNSLNNAYGYTIESAISQGLLTETAEGLVDSGLSASIGASAEYTSLGLNEIFTTTAADVGVSSASGAVNITNTAINVGKLGSIGAFAGAVAVGVGVGVLSKHLWDKYGGYIKYGVSMMTPKEMMDLIPEGGTIGHVRYLYSNYVRDYYIYSSTNFLKVSYPVSNTQDNFVCIMSDRDTCDYRFYNNEQLSNKGRAVYNKYQGRGEAINKESVTETNFNDMKFSSVEEYSAYVRSLDRGDTEFPDIIKKSPDIIGPLGNQYYDSENDSFPGLVNQIPEGSDMEPVNMEDYQDFVDAANQNTEDGNTDESIQGDLFDNLIDPLIVDAPTIPDQPIIPENPDDVPNVPDRPIVPEQPTIPDKPSVTQEDIDQALQGATTIDLRAIFPFCIPFDLYNLLSIFDTGENRRAPHITFTFPFTDWVIDVDLAPFDPVAGILRLLELILFIIGLAVATRALIGAGGSG